MNEEKEMYKPDTPSEYSDSELDIYLDCSGEKGHCTSTFSAETRRILAMAYYFYKRFPRLFVGNHAMLNYFGNLTEEEFGEFVKGKRDFKTLYNFDELTFTKGKWHNGYIIMNDYMGQDILVVGCGHRPLQKYPDDPFFQSYKEEHHHTGCTTLDPDMSQNPDTNGVYGEQTFSHIPDNSFREIQTEGVRLFITPVFLRETLRLLKEGGVLVADDWVFMRKTKGKLIFNPSLASHSEIYMGLPDLYGWGAIKGNWYDYHEYDALTQKRIDKQFPCPHSRCSKVDQQIRKLDEEEVTTLFLNIYFRENNFVFENLDTRNEIVGTVKYHITLFCGNEKMGSFTYFPKTTDFIKSEQKLACGHEAPIETHDFEILSTRIVATSEQGVMRYIFFFRKTTPF